jgi:hypothetical protein
MNYEGFGGAGISPAAFLAKPGERHYGGRRPPYKQLADLLNDHSAWNAPYLIVVLTDN